MCFEEEKTDLGLAETEPITETPMETFQTEEVEPVTTTVMETVGPVLTEAPVTVSEAPRRASSDLVISIVASYCTSYLGHTIIHLIKVFR